MDDEIELIGALRLTADPPQAWIDAAASIPSMLGDLAAIDAAIDSPGFRETYARDPEAAVTAAGLPAGEPVLSALRDRLA